MPEAYKELVSYRDKLELHYKDMQDMEFTIQRNKLWMLQTRNGKRTSAAALKIAVDMCNEGLIDKETAILRVAPENLDQLLHPMLDPDAPRTLLAHGLPASPGAASGQVVFTPTRPRPGRRRATRWFWCASRPRPRTSAACTPLRAS